MKDYSKHLTGTAGEHAVAKIACLKGWVPSLTTKNCPVFDVFLFNPMENKNIIVQVKTIRDKKNESGKVEKRISFPLGGVYHANLEDGLREIICPYVFVHIDCEDNFTFYVLTQNELTDVLRMVDAGQRVKRGENFSPSEGVAVRIKYLEEYKDQWDKIWD